MTKQYDLERTVGIIRSRRMSNSSESYVASLLHGNQERILKKLVEENLELVLAVNSKGIKEIVHEAADLLFHYLVLLEKVNVSLADVVEELVGREGASGFDEKQSREKKGPK